MTVKNNACVSLSAIRHSMEVRLYACVVFVYAICCIKVAEKLSTYHGVPRWLCAGSCTYNRYVLQQFVPTATFNIRFGETL